MMATRTKRKVKGFIITVVLVALLAVGFIFFMRFFGDSLFTVEEVVAVDVTEVMYEKLEGLGELNTAEYMCTYAKPYSSSYSFNGWEIPLTTKSFIVTYDGTVKAGIADMSKVKFSHKGETTILVKLPEMEITNSYLDLDSLVVYDESHNIINPISVDDVNTAQSELVAEMEDAAIEKGILDMAEENAKTMLGAMLSFVEDEGYTIEFA